MSLSLVNQYIFHAEGNTVVHKMCLGIRGKTIQFIYTEYVEKVYIYQAFVCALSNRFTF